jgi:hypothetical protein
MEAAATVIQQQFKSREAMRRAQMQEKFGVGRAGIANPVIRRISNPRFLC